MKKVELRLVFTFVKTVEITDEDYLDLSTIMSDENGQCEKGMNVADSLLADFYQETVDKGIESDYLPDYLSIQDSETEEILFEQD